MSELCSAGILGTGHYAPEKILSNADLERMVDTSDEWIRTRTGIETRHIASRSETTSDLCVKAALPALRLRCGAPLRRSPPWWLRQALAH